MGRCCQQLVVLLGLAVVLAAAEPVAEPNAGHTAEPGYGADDYDSAPPPINEYEETATQWIAVKWEEQPDDPFDCFTNLGLDLTWVFDIDEQWTVYEADDVEAANQAMKGIITILSKEPDVEAAAAAAATTSYGPWGQQEVEAFVNKHIDMVYGENVGSVLAVEPAEVSKECKGPLPDACPSEGLWGLNVIRAPPVWNALPGVANENPTVSVMAIDSGIRTDHIDFRGNLVPELTVQYEFPQSHPSDVDDDPDSSGKGHGTYIAGAIFGRWNNGKRTAVGVVGKARGGMCQCGDNYPTFCVIRCIKHAIDHGVRILNLSFGGLFSQRLDPDSPYRNVVQRFCDEGGLLFASAGNKAVDVLTPGSYVYPAAFAADLEETHPKCVLTVAYVDKAGALGDISNHGESVRIAAPGEDVLGASVKGDKAVEMRTGTSVATALVSGMATLLSNAFPGTCPTRVYDCLVETAAPRKVKPNSYGNAGTINGGIADLQAAYECIRTKPQCPRRGLPACVKPKSGVAVKDCSTDKYCQALNQEFICEYDYANDGDLCKDHDSDGHGLYDVATAAQHVYGEVSEQRADVSVASSQPAAGFPVHKSKAPAQQSNPVGISTALPVRYHRRYRHKHSSSPSGGGAGSRQQHTHSPQHQLASPGHNGRDENAAEWGGEPAEDHTPHNHYTESQQVAQPKQKQQHQGYQAEVEGQHTADQSKAGRQNAKEVDTTGDKKPRPTGDDTTGSKKHDPATKKGDNNKPTAQGGDGHVPVSKQQKLGSSKGGHAEKQQQRKARADEAPGRDQSSKVGGRQQVAEGQEGTKLDPKQGKSTQPSKKKVTAQRDGQSYDDDKQAPKGDEQHFDKFADGDADGKLNDSTQRHSSHSGGKHKDHSTSKRKRHDGDKPGADEQDLYAVNGKAPNNPGRPVDEYDKNESQNKYSRGYRQCGVCQQGRCVSKERQWCAQKKVTQ